MNKIINVLALICSNFIFGQDYFQQKVDFKIQVELNDSLHTLSAYEEFTYTNNSPNSLDFIYIHVWPNAYKNNETALAHQLYRMNNKVLEFASDKNKGYIDSLDFKIDGEKAKWEYDAHHIDIVKLYLNKPLVSGGKINVSTPFKVKLPSGRISRLGHIEESYQITQWYPKPAVYDKNGWHQIPYLTQGEFYSEYGSFEVDITLPKNYVVGATGDLQTESEIEFLNDLAERTALKFKSEGYTNHKNFSGKNKSFPKSDKEFKTIKYTQNNVHDFAWFADKRFEVLKGQVELPHSKRKVTTWAMFVPRHAQVWENAIEYINDGTYYYSKWNGDYQYNQVTAVDGTISAGGGMEYPNVTVIGNAGSKRELEVVIVHEVGHNWFYGMLGSNEREHPWMDEGLNTLNEMRYIATKYPNNTQLSDMMNGLAKGIHAEHLDHHDMSDITYGVSAAGGNDQPIELHSDQYTSMNYGAIVYSKTGLVFTYLKDYLGDSLFDKCMIAYFDAWHFKHPQPEDLRTVLEKTSGKDLSWLFDDIIPTTKQIDYKVSKVKVTDNGTEVTVKNSGKVDGPIRIDAYSFGKLRKTEWVEPGQKKTTVLFPEKTFDQIKIDGNKNIPEVNRNNNQWRKGFLGKIEPLQIEFLIGDNEPDKTNIFVTPIAAYNIYDKFMIGMVIHNISLPKNKFEYLLAPGFSFGRKNLAGYGHIKYTITPSENFKTITYGLKGKTFGFAAVDSNYSYIAINPFIEFVIGKPKGRVHHTQTLKLQGAYNIETTESENTFMGGFGQYNFTYKKTIHEFSTKIRVDYIKSINELFSVMNGHLHANYKLKYWDKKNKSISFSGYYGSKLASTGIIGDRYGLALGGQNGTQDFYYENYLIRRASTNESWLRTRKNNHGGFSTISDKTFASQLITINTFIELPYVPLLGIFVDNALVPYSTKMDHYFQAGIGVRLLNGNIGAYLPLFENQLMKDSFDPTYTKWYQKLRFTFDLSNLNKTSITSAIF